MAQDISSAAQPRPAWRARDARAASRAFAACALAGAMLAVPALAETPTRRAAPAAPIAPPCPEYGPGFVRLSSGGCVRVGGYVRGEAVVRQRRSSWEGRSAPVPALGAGSGVSLEWRSAPASAPARAVVRMRGERRP
jgi:hypothetical protein